MHVGGADGARRGPVRVPRQLPAEVGGCSDEERHPVAVLPAREDVDAGDLVPRRIDVVDVEPRWLTSPSRPPHGIAVGGQRLSPRSCDSKLTEVARQARTSFPRLGDQFGKVVALPGLLGCCSFLPRFLPTDTYARRVAGVSY